MVDATKQAEPPTHRQTRGAPIDPYCADQLRLHDPDHYYALRYASDPARPLLLVLAAFQLELRQIPALVSNAPLGEIRLQWWREAIDEVVEFCRSNRSDPLHSPLGGVRAHPVVQELAQQLAAYLVPNAGQAPPMALSEIELVLTNAIDARTRLLYDEPFTDPVDLLNWARRAEGPFLVMKMRMARRYTTDRQGDLAPEESWFEQAGALYCAARHHGGQVPDLASTHKIDDQHTALMQRFKSWQAEQPAIHESALPLILPMSLIPYYATAQANQRPSPVRRHWQYLKSFLYGRI